MDVGNKMFTREMLKAATGVAQSPICKLVRGTDKDTGVTVVMAAHRNGQFTVLAEYVIPPKPNSIECECEPDHSVAKLGHCATCPGWTPGQATLLEPDLLRGSTGCPPQHGDGSPHNFDWATYADERLSTGVCRCGVSEMDWSIWFLP